METSILWIGGFITICFVIPITFVYFVIDQDNFIRRHKRNKEQK